MTAPEGRANLSGVYFLFSEVGKMGRRGLAGRAAAAAAAVLAAVLIAFGVYVSDYYHADGTVREYLNSDSSAFLGGMIDD